MKKIALLLMSLFILTAVSAQEQKGPRFMKPEEYKNKLKEFIAQRAELTAEETEAFFPLYFELQTEKFKLNGQLRGKTRELMQDGLTEEEATELLDETMEMKLKCDQLDKDYMVKFKKLLPASKLLKIQMAEEGFRRELLQNMQRGIPNFGDRRPNFGDRRLRKDENKK
ncbi:MAG: hypothetical protein IKS80_02530 [Bacteroidaceae bacterium]|nr:hypothetical protein [Bacteroidaceae bacterium]